MTEHYYSSNPSVQSKPFTFETILKGHSLLFTSDLGVFSKKEIDFGSRLLIEAFVIPEVSGGLLDVGCGYGPIGLTLGKEYPDRYITMVDINERALDLAEKNRIQNSVLNVKIYKSDLFNDIKERSFAAILTNPPIRTGKKNVYEIFERSYEYLTSGGELWIVIQKKQGAPSAIEKLQSIFNVVEVVAKKKGYYIIKSKKC
ncbi:class I SAM-dependent methyltransferase [Calidifontibacillus oryziterrae]|uniref:class I SAM-dependent methyltransferase n=1 Tax=Calidifontibacillus oryziterrae TaxID=1191699 RepID=UPI0002F59AFC|nr:class I SAM-dependent methyltransferase [Calidifontibacillus oryziterrae]